MSIEIPPPLTPNNFNSPKTNPFETYDLTFPDNSTLRLTNLNIEVDIGGNIYTPFPLQRSLIKFSIKEYVNQVSIAFSNITKIFSDKILSIDLRGTKITITKYFMEDVNIGIILFRGIADTVTIDEKICQMNFKDFLLAWNKKIPSRTFSYDCGFHFKDKRCGYKGSQEECDKQLSTCQALGNSKYFGGFPYVLELQKRYDGLNMEG